MRENDEAAKYFVHGSVAVPTGYMRGHEPMQAMLPIYNPIGCIHVDCFVKVSERVRETSGAKSYLPARAGFSSVATAKHGQETSAVRYLIKLSRPTLKHTWSKESCCGCFAVCLA